MVMRESVGIERARDRQALDVITARAENPVMRISAPGLFSLTMEISCSMEAVLIAATGWGGAQHHFVDCAAGRHHRIDVLIRRSP